MEMDKFGNLNTDIPFDVLSRLPTKDLVELKFVSKGWHQLVTDPSFIQVQSQRIQPLSGFFFQQRFQWCQDDIVIINYIPMKWEGAELHKKVFDFLPQDVVLLTSCNGLFCCRSCFPFEQPAIFVCNPLNKEWIKLDWAEPDKEKSIALAFDPFQDFSDNSANFKLVSVSQSETEQEEFYFSFEIYSSKTRSWKLSKEICWCNSNLYKNKGVFIGGILHWLTDGDQILTFNVENEFAWLISAPLPAMELNSVPESCIGDSKGCLHYIMISEEGLHVWFLEDYFDCKWSMKHCKTLAAMEQEHGQFFYNLQERVKQRLTGNPWMDPLAFKDGVLLLRVSNTIYLYHIERCKMDEVCDISKFGTNSMFCPTVLPYSMSLVPLLNKA
ncbi:F-box protein At5g49610-like isoform X2 [Hevea brasiliensis]|uniref:F-box protein At5g49610-like isoform X2 n=1 Tax=Hevea brasiliensis TaxID=3981 RepID=UPI0025D99644|nr:F-box protein At5g49610-like isoform X2 [Hevea brasiliensis]